MLRYRVFMLFAVACLAGQAAAADIAQCVQDAKIKPEERIALCTAVVDSGEGDVARALLVRGNAYNSVRDYDRAFADYNKALELKPDYVDAFLSRGMSYYNKAERAAGANKLDPADYDRAMADYDEAVRLEPQNPEALTMRAELFANRYYRSHDDSRSFADFAEALRIKPDFARAHLSRGGLCMMLTDFDCAIADWNATPMIAMLFSSGCNKRVFPDAEREAVLEACNKRLQRRLSVSFAAYDLDSRGYVYLRLGRYDEAIADYDEVLAKFPQIASSLYGRGIARLRKGDAGGSADLAAAEAIRPTIAKTFAGYGISP